MRNLIFPGLFAAVAAVLSPGFSGMHSKAPGDLELRRSLEAIHSTMLDFDSRRVASEGRLASDLASLAESVAATSRTSESEIAKLEDVVSKVRLVATSQLDELAEEFDKKYLALKEEVAEVSDDEGVGTLDVTTLADEGGRPQDFATLVDQVEQLKRDVDALKRRSTLSDAGSRVTYEPITASSGTVSYGCSGGTSQPVYSQPVYSQPVYSQPVYSQPVYSQPVYSSASYGTASAPAVAVSTRRRGLLGGLFRRGATTAVGSTCVVDANGNVVCQ